MLLSSPFVGKSLFVQVGQTFYGPRIQIYISEKVT